MNTAKRMQAFIEKLAAKHNFDLYTRDPDQMGCELILRNEPYMPLGICVLGPNQVSVYHIAYDQAGDRYYDPEIVFFTGYGEWVPMVWNTPEISLGYGRVAGGYREIAWLNPERTEITKFEPIRMKDTAGFANGMWQRNLKKQGFGEVPKTAHAQPPAKPAPVSIFPLAKDWHDRPPLEDGDFWANYHDRMAIVCIARERIARSHRFWKQAEQWETAALTHHERAENYRAGRY